MSDDRRLGNLRLRCANHMLRQYGDKALAEAEDRMRSLARKRAAEGAIIWRRTIRAMEELQRDRPREGEAIH